MQRERRATLLTLAVVGLLTGSGAQVLPITLPITLPPLGNTQLPQISLPPLGNIQLPQVSLPPLGSIQLPQISLPPLALPQISVPPLALPNLELPRAAPGPSPAAAPSHASPASSPPAQAAQAAPPPAQAPETSFNPVAPSVAPEEQAAPTSPEQSPPTAPATGPAVATVSSPSPSPATSVPSSPSPANKPTPTVVLVPFRVVLIIDGPGLELYPMSQSTQYKVDSVVAAALGLAVKQVTIVDIVLLKNTRRRALLQALTNRTIAATFSIAVPQGDDTRTTATLQAAAENGILSAQAMQQGLPAWRFTMQSTTASAQSQSTGRISGGGIAGIVIGGVVFIGIVVGAVLLLRHFKVGCFHSREHAQPGGQGRYNRA